MVTFTLPWQLRPLAWSHQRDVYAILHTHSRRLDFHPHCHVIVTGGGLDKARRQWRKLKGHYLFNGKALAKVFRARVLVRILAVMIAPAMPRVRPVVHCPHCQSPMQAMGFIPPDWSSG